jgi:hypothetical protein
MEQLNRYNSSKNVIVKEDEIRKPKTRLFSPVRLKIEAVKRHKRRLHLHSAD